MNKDVRNRMLALKLLSQTSFTLRTAKHRERSCASSITLSSDPASFNQSETNLTEKQALFISFFLIFLTMVCKKTRQVATNCRY